jgi:acetylornithine deacetylase/succinyl-diaminopimelate desuccinylase-like protein
VPDIEDVLGDIDRNFDAALDKLLELIAIPSISGEPSAETEIVRAAEWLKTELDRVGLPAKVVATRGHPVVLARAAGNTGSARPCLLFYGHYDVQPLGDRAEWKHEPFEPRIVEEEGVRRFYGRGASDSKSQLWSFIEALRAWKSVQGDFPADIIVLLEGEEECGSPSLPGFIEAYRDELKCDVAFICDAEMWSPTQPAITTQLKGLVHEKVTIHAPNPDLHSGHYGAVAANPIRILSTILAGLHDDEGRVTIDGFYEGIIDLPDAMRQQWAELAKEPWLLGEVDLSGGVIEHGYTPLEAMWGRPTVDINGITGGNQGPGERSVLPSAATGRLSFRLVAGQKPDVIRQRFRKHIEARIPEGCRVAFEGESGSSAVALSQESRFLKAAALGLEEEWGAPTVLRGTGGAIPLVEQFKNGLGAECVVIGFILPDDAIHAPDERYDTERLRRGARSYVRILDAIQDQVAKAL